MKFFTKKEAASNCRLLSFPARSRVVHLPFEDPPKMAQRYERAEEQLACYRRVRDAIKLAVGILRERLETA